MTLPRFWRLWTWANPGTYWTRGGLTYQVLRYEGTSSDRKVILRCVKGLPAQPTALRVGEWRRWWLLAREVER